MASSIYRADAFAYVPSIIFSFATCLGANFIASLNEGISNALAERVLLAAYDSFDFVIFCVND